MVKIYSEKLVSNFKGNIIDIETIGNFLSYEDSRKYKNIIPVIFGFINNKGIKIFCAKNRVSIPKIKKNIIKLLPSLEKPFYAFNTDFERGVLFHTLKREINFDKELNLEKFEAKRNAVHFLKIPHYKDPFDDNGLLCSQAWLKGEFESAILHNRSCLLKERDILLKRGFREPDKLEFVK